jgi:hypothetical protein
MIYIRRVSAPRQLQQVLGNADGGATWRLCYKSSLQGIQITTENILTFASSVAEIKSPPENSP